MNQEAKSRAVAVGIYTVKVETEVTQHYECAAWFQTITVPPGDYTVYAFPDYMGRASTDCLYVDVKGPVKEANFTARLGAHYAKEDTHGNKLIGTIQEGSIRLLSWVKDLEKLIDSGVLKLYDNYRMVDSHGYKYYKVSK